MSSIIDDIDEKIGEVQTKSLDMSFGEIVSLHENKELIIDPEYQRLFRWSDEQKSRLIESILLELPIPQIFVIEVVTGAWELVDGLQRISSVIQFINPSILGLEPLTLQGCDIITELNDKTFEQLPLRLRLSIKRSSVRTVIIKRQSKPFLRYEMFKRLNTGGSLLESQEIRNCSARMLGDDGIRFYKFLQEKANDTSFRNCTEETLSDEQKEKKGDEELVLRFLATKNARDLFKGSVRDWLDEYMEEVILGKRPFDYEAEGKDFSKVFSYLDEVLGNGAFVLYRDDTPTGGLKPAYFEAVSVGTLSALDRICDIPKELVKKQIIKTVQGEEFRKYIGPGANSKQKLEKRIATIQDALLRLSNE